MTILNNALGANLTLAAVGQTLSVNIPMKTQIYTGQGGVSLLCYITGTLTASVQVSNDPLANANNIASVQNTARWINHDILSSLTASKNSSIVFPVYAVRLVVTAWTSGSAFLDIGALDYLL